MSMLITVHLTSFPLVFSADLDVGCEIVLSRLPIPYATFNAWIGYHSGEERCRDQ